MLLCYCCSFYSVLDKYLIKMNKKNKQTKLKPRAAKFMSLLLFC